MSDDDVGYCNPPKHSRFRKGVCPNPLGRGRRISSQEARIVEKIMTTKISFRENGKQKSASRAEVSIKRLVTSALNGDVNDAAQLIKLRLQAHRIDPGPIVVKINGGIPDKTD